MSSRYSCSRQRLTEQLLPISSYHSPPFDVVPQSQVFSGLQLLFLSIRFFSSPFFLDPRLLSFQVQIFFQVGFCSWFLLRSDGTALLHTRGCIPIKKKYL